MWLYDISNYIYSRDMNRKIAIVKRDELVPGSKDSFSFWAWKQNIYTVVEEWHTPESQGDTGDWDYYTFMTYMDASIFIAELAMKLNTPMQRILAEEAEKFVTQVTQDHKKVLKQMEAEQREREVKAKKLERARNMRHVYAFELTNGTVKIGVSNNVGRRRSDIANSSGMEISRWCYTKPFPKERAFAIEADCHRFFNEQRTKGEFFKITYDAAKDKLQTYGTVFEGNQSADDTYGEHKDKEN